jgi:tetratricopeptide (TPR) repeat protein
MNALRRTVNIPLTLTVAFALSVAFTAQAHSTDAEFAALLRADKVKEAEQLARQRVASNPRDEVALWTLGRLTGSDAAARKDLLPKAEACVAQQPQSARCHNLIGTLLGAQAQSGGMGEALKLIGRIRDGLVKGVELDPTHYQLRRDLVQFYLIAPGIAGGSVRKAREQVEDFAQRDAARGALLRTEPAAYEEDFAKAQTLVESVKPGGDADLSDDLRSTRTTLGFALLAKDRAAEARQQFERIIAEAPTQAIAHLGLGRALLGQDQPAAAIAALERGLQIDPKLRVHYRLGLAYEKLGDKARAVAAFKTFLGYQTEGRQADEVRKRLAALGG